MLFSIPIAIPIPIPMWLDNFCVFAKPVFLYEQARAARDCPAGKGLCRPKGL